MAWLAIVAMLLLALAPTVSQVLGSHAPSHHRDASAHATHASQGHAHASADEGCGGDCWNKCGYCDFLAHAPALPGIAYALGLARPVATAAPLERRPAPRRAARFTLAQPRGPPFLA